MEELISVIVPIYKVEEYLEECVNSLINQTYKNIEIILVDDGSPDECPKICEKLALSDNRIKVLHKENGGLSDARNYGTERASGDLVIYVDSDDFVEPDLIETLYSLLSEYNTKVAIACHDETIENGFHVDLDGTVVAGSSLEILSLMFTEFSWAAWGKLFRKSLLAEKPFEKGILYEDFELIPKTVMKAENAVIIKKALYHYRIRQDSIMGKSKKGYSADYIYVASKNMEYFKNYQASTDEREALVASLFIRIFRDFCKQYDNDGNCLSDEFARQEKQYIKRYLKDITHNKYLPNKYKLSYLIMSVSIGLYGKLQCLKK